MAKKKTAPQATAQKTLQEQVRENNIEALTKMTALLEEMKTVSDTIMAADAKDKALMQRLDQIPRMIGQVMAHAMKEYDAPVETDKPSDEPAETPSEASA